MSVKIEMEGEGFAFDRKIPMSVAVEIVQLVEQEDFEIEEEVSDTTEGKTDEGETNQTDGDGKKEGMEGWR